MVTNGTETWSPNKLTCKLIAFFVREFLSFYIAEDVAPHERREAHKDNSELRRHQVEVDGLRGKPEEARALEGRHKLGLQFVEGAFLHLHQRHSGEENHEQRRREDELIEQQLPQNYLLRGTGKGAVCRRQIVLQII